MADFDPDQLDAIETAKADAVVPCGTCNACCHSPVEVSPDFGDNPDDYELAISVDTSAANGLQMITLDRREDGSCYALKAGRCSIWSKRPKICRAFDCRKIFWMFDKAGRRELLAKGYFRKAVLDAGRNRADTLPEGPKLREAARLVDFGSRSIGFMETRRGFRRG